MKAIVCTAYGSPEVLHLMEVEKPVPKDGEVLIRIVASTVTFGDCEIRTLTLPRWTRIPLRVYMGYRKPRKYITGMEVSGIIEAVGKNVTKLKVGDEVFGSSGLARGANAEYVCRPAKSLAIKPRDVSFEDVVTIVVGGINAWHFLRKANIQQGQKVLIIGAGGSIGTYAVMIAKLLGAEVTAIDHAAKLDMLRSIGADQVIDYTREDFGKRNEKYDVILDIVYTSSFSKCIDMLADDGCYLMANTGPRRMLKGLWISWATRKKVVSALAAETVEDLSYIAELIRSGKIKPVIDKIFPLEKTAEAQAYVEKGHKKGCVVIKH